MSLSMTLNRFREISFQASPYKIKNAISMIGSKQNEHITVINETSFSVWTRKNYGRFLQKLVTELVLQKGEKLVNFDDNYERKTIVTSLQVRR